MIIINSPKNCINERIYIYKFIFENQFKIKTNINYGNYSSIEILNTSNNLKLIFPDIFFKNNEFKWLKKIEINKIITQNWELINEVYKVPIPFYEIIQSKDYKDEIAIDFFGFIFFKLTQYEECVLSDYDAHGRFNSWKSILADYSNLPLVDIYLEKLKNHINSHLKTNIVINYSYRLNLTSDLDFPLHLDKNIVRNARKVIKSLSCKYNLKDKRKLLVDMYYLYFTKDVKYVDRYNNGIVFIKNLAHELDTSCKFYIIPKKTSIYDFQTLEDSRVLELIRALQGDGIEIGMHPGYETYKSLENMVSSVNQFKNLTQLKNLDTRQHYLRWSQAKTVQILDRLGVNTDSTIGYSDNFGFRCGTAKSFNLYSLSDHKETDIKEFPIIFMDTALFNFPRKISRNIKKINRIKELCKTFGGNFTCILHNHNYDNQYNRMLIKNIIN